MDPAEYPWARRVECAIIDTKSFLKSDEDVYTSAESYDCTRLAADLVRLREQPCAAVSITGGPTIEAKQRLVLLHGPHVLCREGEWAALDGLFDLTLDLTLCDYDVTSSRDYEDDVGGAFVPEGVSPRVLQAQMQFMSWQEKCASDVSFSLPLEAGTVVFLPETITIAPPLRRSASLLAVGLNPSYQKTLQMQELQVGDVNRAEELSITVGGKGQHFALASNRLGKGSVKVAHFLGKNSQEGEQMFAKLEEMGVEQEVQWHEGVTRTCMTILEKSGRMTEVIEPSDEIPQADVDCLLARLVSSVSERAGVALCGTFPPGVKEEVYAGLAQSVGVDTILLLDGWKGVEQTLASRRVNVLKINAQELKWLTGEAELDTAAAAAMRAYMPAGALLAVTRGASSALLYQRQASRADTSTESGDSISVTEFEIEAVPCLNPIGAGDTCSAVLLYGLCAGSRMRSTDVLRDCGTISRCSRPPSCRFGNLPCLWLCCISHNRLAAPPPPTDSRTSAEQDVRRRTHLHLRWLPLLPRA